MVTLRWWLVLFLLWIKAPAYGMSHHKDSNCHYIFNVQIFDFKGGTYKVYYNDTFLIKLKAKRGHHLDTLILVVDTTFAKCSDADILPITVYKKWLFGYKDIDLIIPYCSEYPFLCLLSDTRLKRRYRLNGIWMKYRYQIVD